MSDGQSRALSEGAQSNRQPGPSPLIETGIRELEDSCSSPIEPSGVMDTEIFTVGTAVTRDPKRAASGRNCSFILAEL